jgi:hypothetical protein
MSPLLGFRIDRAAIGVDILEGGVACRYCGCRTKTEVNEVAMASQANFWTAAPLSSQATNSDVGDLYEFLTCAE